MIVFWNENTTIITIATISGTYVPNYEGGPIFMAGTVSSAGGPRRAGAESRPWYFC